MVVWLPGCGSKKIPPPVNKTKDSIIPTTVSESVKQDTISEFDISLCVGLETDTLKKWCNKFLKDQAGTLSVPASQEFLTAIHCPYKTGDDSQAGFVLDSLNLDQYLVYVYLYETPLLVTVINSRSGSVVMARDWSNYVYHHFYGISSFGKYYSLSLGHSSQALETAETILFNSELKRVFSSLGYNNIWNDEEDDKHQDDLREISLSIVNDSLLLEKYSYRRMIGDKQVKSYETEVLYQMRNDTIICIEPDKLKTIRKKDKEYNLN